MKVEDFIAHEEVNIRELQDKIAQKRRYVQWLQLAREKYPTLSLESRYNKPIQTDLSLFTDCIISENPGHYSGDRDELVFKPFLVFEKVEIFHVKTVIFGTYEYSRGKIYYDILPEFGELVAGHSLAVKKKIQEFIEKVLLDEEYCLCYSGNWKEVFPDFME